MLSMYPPSPTSPSNATAASSPSSSLRSKVYSDASCAISASAPSKPVTVTLFAVPAHLAMLTVVEPADDAPKATMPPPPPPPASPESTTTPP